MPLERLGDDLAAGEAPDIAVSSGEDVDAGVVEADDVERPDADLLGAGLGHLLVGALRVALGEDVVGAVFHEPVVVRGAVDVLGEEVKLLAKRLVG